jgi:hypothetical protein
MGETNALAQRTGGCRPGGCSTTAIRLYSGSFPAEGDRVRATFEFVFLTGWAPADSQPKPLRPGSARRGSPMRWARRTPTGDPVPPAARLTFGEMTLCRWHLRPPRT